MEDLKSYNLMLENNLEIDSLPEKLEGKVMMLEDLLEKHEDSKDEDERKELEMKIESCDQGLYGDVVQYLKEVKTENVDNEGKKIETEDKSPKTELIIAGRPAWRFWM